MFLDTTNGAHVGQQTSLMNICILTAPPTGHSSVSHPFFRAPCFLRQNNNEIKPVNYPQWPSIVLVKGSITCVLF